MEKEELKLPPTFIELAEKHFLSFKQYSYQLRDLMAELDNILNCKGDTLTRERARQTGKTTSITLIALICMIFLPELAKKEEYLIKYPILKEFKKGFNIGVVAPRLKQAIIPMKRLQKIVIRPELLELTKRLNIKILNSAQELFNLSNGSSMVAMSGNPVTAQEGESFHLLIIDEAQRMKPYSWYKVYAPMVSSTNGTTLAFGTAWTTETSFAKEIKLNKNNGLHSRITYEEALKHGKYYKKWLANAIKRMPGGKESRNFKLNFALICDKSEKNPISVEAWEDIDMLEDYLPGETEGENIYVGIDWGKIGNCTFVAIGEKLLDKIRLIDLLELQGDDYPTQHVLIQTFLNEYPKIKRIWSESTGLGGPNTDFLIAAYGKIVQPITAYMLPLLHEKLLNEISNKRLKRPKIKEEGPWKSLSRQFINCEKVQQGSTFKLVASKDKDEDEDEDEQDDGIDATAYMIGAALNDKLFSFVFKKCIRTARHLMGGNNNRLLTKKLDRGKTSKKIKNF